ncbi:BON domain-containing protein [Granulicella pectinivorans]|jgi:hypothetical protein|uniref:BON domain-containing protein n=1 Tax=Granulicella pectinivorans TaxID=474950 RepID=A0A1I6N0D0_9BACT|nr:BON domain-containing protein [Granulicella pectinivorans]SFS21399.1 BON domain-containing protein [Granulicella pectinivorans]
MKNETNFVRRSVSLAGLGLGLVLSVAGCKSAPPVDDAALNTALQNKLQADAGLSGQPIQTAVVGGVASLTGSVTNEAARSLAANDAAQVAGIRVVNNNLTVTQEAPVATPAPAAVEVAPTPAPVAPTPRIAKVEKHPAPIDRRTPPPQNYPQQNSPAPPPTQPAQAYQPPPPPPAPARPAFRDVTIPSGTTLAVRVTQTLDSATTQPGESFSGALASDVIVDGLVAFPTGTRVAGKVTDAKDAGHYSGNSRLAVTLTSLSRRGDTIPISTDAFSKEGTGRGKNTAEKIGGGAAVGAILGGIFGGGKGAAIGAGAGGALGAGANTVTRGQQVQIVSESVVRFSTTSPITVRVPTGGNNGQNGDLQRHDQ